MVSASGIQQAELLAADGAAGDNLGFAVAIDGDTALVGAPGSDAGASADQGAVYVFERSGTTWTRTQKLTSTEGAAGDQFGYAVAFDGDTAVIGAFCAEVGPGLDQGAAYVFTRAGTSWVQQQKLVASDAAAADVFGYTVAVSGETALVGAIYDDVGGAIDRGSAYVFVRSGTTWTQQQQLIAADGAADDRFATSVALSGETALVGAVYDDVGGNPDQGSAYIFLRSRDTWSLQRKVTAADGAGGDCFGNSVALEGDTALVGAVYDDVGDDMNLGSAHVFVRNGAEWSLQQKLVPPGGDEKWFGSVALSGDEALVGAMHDLAWDEGAAYMFVRSGSAWSQECQLVADDGAIGDFLGYSVALSGDTALVGAFRHDVGANADQGSAYAFVIDATAPVTDAVVTPAPNTEGWNKGAVSLSLVATDDVSSVATTEYRLSGAPSWTTYTAPIPVSSEGVTTYQYRSTDVAGNTEPTGSIVVRIDATPPVTAASASPLPNAAGWNKGPVTVSFTASDAGSGIAVTEHSTDGGATWTEGTSASVTAERTTTVSYRSVDLAGNVEAAGTIIVRLDGTAPMTTASVLPAPNAAGWNKGPVTLSFAATDQASGVDHVEYSIDAVTWTIGDSLPVSTLGTTVVSHRAVDKAGNVAATKTKTVRIDTTRPVTRALADVSVRRGRSATLRLRVNDIVAPKATVTVKIYRRGDLKRTLHLGLRVTNVEVRYHFICRLARGTYTWKVSAVDLAGNRQSKVGYRKLVVR